VPEWTVHGRRPVYESPWVELELVDVELPDGQRFEHHVLHIPGNASVALARDAGRRILLLQRHRFITGRWGWELPGGRIDDGETPEEAAAREMLEEAGWRAGTLRHLTSYFPLAGLSDQQFHVFLAEGSEYVREPDGIEAARVEWLPVGRVRELIRTGEVSDGFSLTALLWYLAVEEAT
jgi:8-oxo-dGTP pyrophosphatase MutT (NUDIX family)